MFLVLVLHTVSVAQPERETVVRILSGRDPVACSTIDASVETLREVVQTVSMPPWVPMRAAHCMIEGHAQTIEDDLSSWVVDPETLGLGLLVLSELDLLPSELAVRVARLALTQGPSPERAAKRIVLAHQAEVRALVTP